MSVLIEIYQAETGKKYLLADFEKWAEKKYNEFMKEKSKTYKEYVPSGTLAYLFLQIRAESLGFMTWMGEKSVNMTDVTPKG